MSEEGHAGGAVRQSQPGAAADLQIGDVDMPVLRSGFGAAGILCETVSPRWRDAVPGFRPPAVEDEFWMMQALRTAMSSAGLPNPNPTVGCVFVRNGTLLSSGATDRFGGVHAEKAAVSAIGDPSELAGATAYVTLEPCSHFGRQPPCAEMLASLGLERCVIGVRDPNPLVDGAGIARLRAAGTRIDSGVLAPELTAWHAPFLLHHKLGRTVFVAKWAQTLDGQMSLDSPGRRWLTGPVARSHAHWLRRRYDAIMVGAGTVLADDPSLTARDCASPVPRHPVRIVFDPRGRLLRVLPDRLSAWRKTLFSDHAPTLILVGRDRIAAAGSRTRGLPDTVHVLGLEPFAPIGGLHSLLAGEEVVRVLGHPVTSVLVEGGPTLLSMMGEAGLIDLAHLFIAPFAGGGFRYRLSGSFTLGDGRPMSLIAAARLGQDVLADYACGAAARHFAALSTQSAEGTSSGTAMEPAGRMPPSTIPFTQEASA